MSTPAIRFYLFSQAPSHQRGKLVFLLRRALDCWCHPHTMSKTKLSPKRNLGLAYSLARERYAALGVDADQALKQLATILISMDCWQGDDVGAEVS